MNLCVLTATPRRALLKAPVTLNIRLILSILATLGFIQHLYPSSSEAQKLVSSPSQYSGYSAEIYDGYQRFSQYITVRDSTKLAVDIYRPTKGGVLHGKPLPVVWAATQYHRVNVGADGKLSTLKDNPVFAPGLETILKHGYVIALLDVRGSGASFGIRGIMHSLSDVWNLYDVNEWLATQSWCSGKTGMFGPSFLGRTQYLTAMSGAPHLKCIFPEVAAIETPLQTINGVANVSSMARLDETMYTLNVARPAAPVDEDIDGTLLKAAVEDHKRNPSYLADRKSTPFTDSYSPIWKTKIYMDASFPRWLYDINTSGVAVCIWGGWSDMFAHDAFQWYASLKTPKRLVVGPWFHAQEVQSKAPMDWTIEHLRWYDYWLKGIDNGIMKESPIWYYTAGTTAGNEWRTAREWPVPATKMTTIFYKVLRPEP